MEPRRGLQWALVVSGIDALDVPRPYRDERMTCTAVAPEAVFTVLMEDTRPFYGPI